MIIDLTLILSFSKIIKTVKKLFYYLKHWPFEFLLSGILLPYPCSHFCFDIKFGDRLYSKEKRKALPVFFWIKSVAKFDIKVKVTTWIGQKGDNYELYIYCPLLDKTIFFLLETKKGCVTNNLRILFGRSAFWCWDFASISFQKMWIKSWNQFFIFD